LPCASTRPQAANHRTSARQPARAMLLMFISSPPAVAARLRAPPTRRCLPGSALSS
jgi:hypothetical protein